MGANPTNINVNFAYTEQNCNMQYENMYFICNTGSDCNNMGPLEAGGRGLTCWSPASQTSITCNSTTHFKCAVSDL